MTRRLGRSLFALAAATGTATGLALAAPSALASPTPGPEANSQAAPADTSELPPAAVDAMKRDLHLATDQAVKERLDVDAQARGVEHKLHQKFGKHYGGTWVNDAGTRVLVGVTSAKQATAARQLGAIPTTVDDPLSALDQVKAELDHHKSDAGKNVTGWYVDQKKNQVVVAATSQKAARKFLSRSGLTDENIATTLSAGRAHTVGGDLHGGVEYRHITSQGNGGISYVMCSIGFPVQGGGFLSAGHCGSPGQDVVDTNWDALGTYQASSFPGNDYSWVKTTSTWKLTAEIDNYNGGLVPVMGSDEAPVGSSVCRSGRTTHWQCGTITQKNFTIHYGSGDVTGAVAMTACAGGGDSGGSVVSGNQAQGMTSGISGDCGDPGFQSFYYPVNAALNAYHLKLAVGPSIQGFNDKCIDVPNSDFSDSVQLQIWNCNSTDAQAVRFESDGTIRIGGKCLDLRQSNTSDGTAVQIYHCNNTMAQQFTLNSAGDLVSLLANKCVDVTGWNGNNGTKLQIWGCSGGDNQKWHQR